MSQTEAEKTGRSPDCAERAGKAALMEPVAYARFTDGTQRAVYGLPDGRQYVEDDDGCRVVGYWYIPCEDWERLFAEPIIVEAPQRSGNDAGRQPGIPHSDPARPTPLSHDR